MNTQLNNEWREQIQTILTQRITNTFLDIQILRLIYKQPVWGYQIKKQIEMDFAIKIRHGRLYPLLNNLEKKKFVQSKIDKKEGRTRKVYSITKNGEEYLKIYNVVLKEQIKPEIMN